MKAKLKDNFHIDKNHTLIAGSEVEITDGWCGCNGYYYRCILPDNEQMYVGGNEYAGMQQVINENILEIIDRTPYIDWEQRRYELAKEYSKEFVKLQHYKGLSENGLSNPKVIEWSVELADSLIEELKKNK